METRNTVRRTSRALFHEPVPPVNPWTVGKLATAITNAMTRKIASFFCMISSVSFRKDVMLSLDGFDSTVYYNCVGCVFWIETALYTKPNKRHVKYALITLITINEPLVIIIKWLPHRRQAAVNLDKFILTTSFKNVR